MLMMGGRRHCHRNVKVLAFYTWLCSAAAIVKTFDIAALLEADWLQDEQGEPVAFAAP
jgi:hypothetical protein